jgi:hypothetical protein
MAFTEGHGLSKGRPEYYLTSAEKMRRLIKKKDVLEILSVVITHAKAGDLNACKIILDKVIPSLKAVEVRDERESNANALTINIIDAMKEVLELGELEEDDDL